MARSISSTSRRKIIANIAALLPALTTPLSSEAKTANLRQNLDRTSVLSGPQINQLLKTLEKQLPGISKIKRGNLMIGYQSTNSGSVNVNYIKGCDSAFSCNSNKSTPDHCHTQACIGFKEFDGNCNMHMCEKNDSGKTNCNSHICDTHDCSTHNCNVFIDQKEDIDPQHKTWKKLRRMPKPEQLDVELQETR